MGKSKDEIIADIRNYMNQQGGRPSTWYTGISEDAETRLSDGHNVKVKGGTISWITRFASSSPVAREIEKYFLDIIGTDGGSGGGSNASSQVYAYRKTSATTP